MHTDSGRERVTRGTAQARQRPISGRCDRGAICLALYFVSGRWPLAAPSGWPSAGPAPSGRSRRASFPQARPDCKQSLEPRNLLSSVGVAELNRLLASRLQAGRPASWSPRLSARRSSSQPASIGIGNSNGKRAAAPALRNSRAFRLALLLRSRRRRRRLAVLTGGPLIAPSP